MQNGFIKVAAASPGLRVADCTYNAGEIIAAAHAAAAAGVRLLVTPELGITGYTCGDLFQQQTLLSAAAAALRDIAAQTAKLGLVVVAGLPLSHRGKLYNCAAVVVAGQILGFVPKSQPPNYGEFYELRHFTPAFAGVERIEAGPFRGVPIGVQMLFRCEQCPDFTLAVELCEDLWVPAPPSIFHAVAGATIIANPSASNETVGKAAWRRSLVAEQSGRLACGYVYADAGTGESTTDMVFSGHNIIAENGEVLAESALFSGGMAVTDIDLDRLVHERQRLTSFPDAGSGAYITAWFPLPVEKTALTRSIGSSPFIPLDEKDLADRAETILSIQAAGLQKRMQHVGAKTAVLGVSGGLDSSLALLVAARAFASMGKPASDILAVTMPGFGTTARTRGNAEKLSEALGATLMSIDISDVTRAHFADIGHSEDNHNVVYENAQARLRTLTLMDIANQQNGLVIGTGDLSELALGWATYNGDHMSMYGVNVSVPKTLIKHLIAHEAQRDAALTATLEDILETPVSPELLPPKDGVISQETEQIIGPYQLHDFFLYYVLRWGFSPTKILRLAEAAFEGSYPRKTILEWMRVFFRRFFAQQFKRSCLPDGPKVGSVSLSPRGDWRMPSDAVASAWMAELDILAD